MIRHSLFIALLLTAVSAAVGLGQGQSSSTRPTAAQAQAALTDPAIRARIMAQIRASGMTPDQIRQQLKSAGYSDDVIDQLTGAPGIDTTAALSEDVFAAVRSLGILDSAVVDSLHRPFVLRKRQRTFADSALLDTLRDALKDDSLRAAIHSL